MLSSFETLFLRAPRGLLSRFRLAFYRLFGLRAGHGNRVERIRCRRLSQIVLGDRNALTDGCWLWPTEHPGEGVRIRIGHGNYFNRDCTIDANGLIEIGDDNMFGPGVFITDSNHETQRGVRPSDLKMEVGHVKIGHRCWVGARAIILKDVELGDDCIVGAGAVVTKSFPAGSTIVGVPARLIPAKHGSSPL